MKENIYIFDFDGVLADSKQFHLECLRAHTGIDISEEDLENMQRHNFYSSQIYQENEEKFRGYGSFIEKNEQVIPLFRGMYDLVRACQRQGLCYIVSSGNEKKIKSFLKHYSLDDVFDNRIMGAQTHFSKVVKLDAIRARHDTAEYFFVTDTVGDIREGYAAEIPTYAVTWGHHSKEDLLQADPVMVCDKVEELSTALSLEVN